MLPFRKPKLGLLGLMTDGYEPIFVGITAGATFAGALRVCEDAPTGATVLCMLPDTGERYLSTTLFEDIHADMNKEEMAISR